MSESVDSVTNPEKNSEEEVQNEVTGAIALLKNKYGLTPNNFEYLKLREIARASLSQRKDAEERLESDYRKMEETYKIDNATFEKESKDWGRIGYSLGTEFEETAIRFLMECYDLPNLYLPKDGEKVLIDEGIKQHLRNLQKQRYMDQQ